MIQRVKKGDKKIGDKKKRQKKEEVAANIFENSSSISISRKTVMSKLLIPETFGATYCCSLWGQTIRLQHLHPIKQPPSSPHIKG